MPAPTAPSIAVINRLGALSDYRETWQLQREIHAEVAEGSRPGTLVLVEHPSVFTAGKRTQASDLPWDGSEVIDVDRAAASRGTVPARLSVIRL